MLRRLVTDARLTFAIVLSLAMPAMAAEPAASGPETPVPVAETPVPVAGTSALAAGTSEPDPVFAEPSTECDPECRAGFVCDAGACTAVCEPACADGEACTEGTCRFHCDPACPEGHRCTNAGQCEQRAASPEPASPEPSTPATSQPRIEHPSKRTKGIALIAIGAAVIFVGGHGVPSGLLWRLSARSKRDELQRTDAPAAEIEQADRRVQRATGLIIAGAAAIAVGLPIFIIGVVRQEKGGNKTKIYTRRRGHRLDPSIGLGRNEATIGVRMRF